MSHPWYMIVIPWYILFWGTVAWAIRRNGPGRVKHSVRCPDKNAGARLVVLYREPEFGSVKASDVTACTLFGTAPITCDKTCLARL